MTKALAAAPRALDVTADARALLGQLKLWNSNFALSPSELAPKVEGRKADLLSLQADLIARTAGAEPKQAAVRLETLFARYPALETDHALEDALMMEWLEDLSDVPDDILALACKRWRMKDTGWAPKSAGQLLALVRAEMGERLGHLSRVNRALRALERAR